MITPIIFYLFSAVMIAASLGVIFARNPVHAVISLIAVFFNASGLFLMLGAEFVAMALVIVYVGAVAVLFLFVVMMLDISSAFSKPDYKGYRMAAAVTGILLAGETIFVFSRWKGAENAASQVAYPKGDIPDISDTASIGRLLYTDYVWMFQIAGLILLCAMIAAITLTQRVRGGIRRQNTVDQVSRKREDVLKITTPKSGEGVQ